MRRVRHRSLRRRISGSPERPRLAVFRSARHIYAQIIDDTRGVTIVSASTLDKDLKKSASGAKTDQSRTVGQVLAQRALERNVTKVLLGPWWSQLSRPSCRVGGRRQESRS